MILLIKSMTGYGRGEFQDGGRRFIVELKSVNHKYSDVYIKMPRQIGYLEDKVMETVKSQLSRGKTDVFITYEFYGEDSKKVQLDAPLAKAYIDACRALADNFDLQNDMAVSLVAKFPDVLRVEQDSEDEDMIWGMLLIALNSALRANKEMRGTEGERLAADVSDKLSILNELTDKISERAPFVVTEYKEKLHDRIKELSEQQVIDENRLSTEVLYFAERCDINEELVRLKSHISQMSDCLKLSEPVGKKLDFLVQELNREINTIGSKANDLLITRNVVEAKTVIDKIREQVQNIE
ncbi:MAG: YicC family protein [Eubacteriales bacterium]|nr:YicC family protein [Eubacteriales bacterium]